MVTKPDTYFPWATSDGITQDIVVTYQGVTTQYTVDNKTTPTNQFQTSGILYDQGMPIQYWNYQLDGYDKWIKHLDQHYSVGDVIERSDLVTAGEVSERLGGSWAFMDFRTQDYPTKITTYFWKKTA